MKNVHLQKRTILKFLLPFLGILMSVKTYGQAKADSLSTSSYHIAVVTSSKGLGNIPVSAFVFGALFVMMVYGIYHYWANGALRDDMSAE
jgi:hypothetical protein